MAAVSPTKIVVGVDGGKFSEAAFSKALKLFAPQSSHFSIVHVRPDEAEFRLDGFYLSKEQMEEMEQVRRDQCQEVLDKYRALAAQAGLQHFSIVELEGDPREELCSFCAQVHADVLMLGTKGAGPIQRLFMGSVSVYCVYHAACPVLIHREEEDPELPPSSLLRQQDGS